MLFLVFLFLVAGLSGGSRGSAGWMLRPRVFCHFSTAGVTGVVGLESR